MPDADPCVVFVGNLSWDVTWKELKDYMKSAGEVTHADIMTRDDGKSKGFASEEDAATAIEDLNETEFEGRMIFVRADGGGKGGGRGGGGADRGKGGRGGNRSTPYERPGKGKGKGKDKGKGKGKGGKASKESLDDDLDSYFGGSKEGEARKEKKVENLDDDLDSYFAAKKSE